MVLEFDVFSVKPTHRFCQQLNEQLLSKCFISNLRFKPLICIFTIVPKKCVRAWFVGLLFLPCLQAHQLPLRPVGKPVRLKHTVDIMFRLQLLRNLWWLHFIYPESLWTFMLKKRRFLPFWLTKAKSTSFLLRLEFKWHALKQTR